MKGPITIALDAMGGDRAPDMVIQGMKVVHVRSPEVRFLMFGDQARLEPLLAGGPTAYCEIRHTDQVVADKDKPSRALRRGGRTSPQMAALSNSRDADHFYEN